MDIPRVRDKVMHIPGVKDIKKHVGINTASREMLIMDRFNAGAERGVVFATSLIENLA